MGLCPEPALGSSNVAITLSGACWAGVRMLWFSHSDQACLLAGCMGWLGQWPAV